jgi:hypothetical protein
MSASRQELKDEAYRDHVFAYVEKEDTPRPLLFQLDLLRQVEFFAGRNPPQERMLCRLRRREGLNVSAG